jgi:hypothetical protein
VWGVLILGFGLEFVTALVHAEWLHAIVSSVGLVGLMAAALHWTRVKTWAARYLSPTWVAATFSLLFLAIILAPFVEQRRWPFSIVFHDPPTAEDIAKATAPIRAERDAAIRQRDQAIRERDDAKRETQTLREQQRAPASQEQSSSLSAEDIATKIGVWQSINQQMNDLAGILNQGYAMLDKWLPDAKSNRTDLINRATALEASVQKFRTGLDQLRSLYLKDTDIATALDAVHLPGGRVDASYSVFTSLPYSIVQFVQHLQNLSDPLPKDVEYEMVPYIGAFRRDLNAMRDWQSQVRQTAATQDAELSKMKAK